MASTKAAAFPSNLSSADSSSDLLSAGSPFNNVLSSGSWFYTTAVILLSLLVLEQTVYRYKKRHLPGDTWTIPLIGKFADSLKPTMEGYMKQWNSGALSAISVFNVYVRHSRGT
jgi:sterol 22-desaturase